MHILERISLNLDSNFTEVSIIRYIHTCMEQTWAYVEGRGKKIGFNTHHYMYSHMRGWRQSGRKIHSTRNGFNTQFSASPAKPFSALHRQGRSTQGTPLGNRIYANIPAVAERDYPYTRPCPATTPHMCEHTFRVQLTVSQQWLRQWLSTVPL